MYTLLCSSCSLTILFTFQCNEKRVAKLSADMLTLLCDHVDKLLDFHPGLPKRIVEVGTLVIDSNTVNFLNIWTPKTFVVVTLKFELCGSAIE